MSLNNLNLLFVVDDKEWRSLFAIVTLTPDRIVRTTSTGTENYPAIPLAAIPTPRNFTPVSSLRQLKTNKKSFLGSLWSAPDRRNINDATSGIIAKTASKGLQKLKGL